MVYSTLFKDMFAKYIQSKKRRDRFDISLENLLITTS